MALHCQTVAEGLHLEGSFWLREGLGIRVMKMSSLLILFIYIK